MSDNRITPAEKLVSVTASDATTYTPHLRALYVGASGDVTLIDLAGTSITLTALAAGVFHPVCATKIMSTGTTATGIVGVYA